MSESTPHPMYSFPKSDAERVVLLENLYADLDHPNPTSQMSLASRINALSNLRLTEAINRTASEIESARAVLGESAAASDRSAAALVFWTKWLAFATIVLAGLTAVVAVEAAHRMNWF